MNGELFDDMSLDNKMRSMGDRELLEFAVREIVKTTRAVDITCKIQEDHDKRLKVLEDREKRVMARSGIISGIVAGLVLGISIVKDMLMGR